MEGTKIKFSGNGNGDGIGYMVGKSSEIPVFKEPKVEDEKMEPSKERMEMINSSFAKIFSKEANKDVHITVAKDGIERKKGMDLFLTLGLYDTGMLSKLKVMFNAASSKIEDLSEENIDSSIKKFFIENVDSLKGSDDMKKAIKAMCNNYSESSSESKVDAQEVDEELKKDIESLHDNFCDLAIELENKNNADRDSGLYSEGAIGFFNEEAKKIDALILEINGRVNSEGEILEFSNEIRDFFNNHIEKIKKMEKEYDENKKKFKKVKSTDATISEKKEYTILSLKKHVENITKGLIKKIEDADAEMLAPLDSFIGKFKVIDKGNLSDQDTKLFESYCAYGIREIEKVWNEKVQIRNEKNDKNKATAINFRKAAGLIERPDLSMGEFEKKYGTGNLVEVADTDAYHRLLNYADIIEGHHVDGLKNDEIEKFWNNYQSFVDYVVQINDPENTEKLIVIDGKTFSVSKDLKEVEISDNVDAEKENAEKERIFGIALGLAREFKTGLVDAVKGSEEWEKRRKKYQESFLEGEVVAFMDQLIEQEKIVAENEKDDFIEKILSELFAGKGERKIEN